MKVVLFYHSRQLVLTLTSIMIYIHWRTYHLGLFGEGEEGRREGEKEMLPLEVEEAEVLQAEVRHYLLSSPRNQPELSLSFQTPEKSLAEQQH